ncbi:two-component sensor histidine kinase BarA [Litorilituus lipolyticus]|uniref:histidine kinase n=1 Tax=Litorilituus lipolyticus TaxID=2491017 RepID=A0A502KY49_9GAMM|nr:two-component sensor histidine kinase BarA [Litorilituus lipolyticus]TPH16572.1 two-component sensor histidine kinase BarA [Litorilituus lipolyticus]
MHKKSLKDWVILITIIPTGIIAFGLAGYFSYSRHVELDNFINQRAFSIIEPLAIMSKDPLINKDREKLRQLIGFTHRTQSSIIDSIIIFTRDNQVFVTSAYNGNTELMRIKQEAPLNNYTQLEETNDYIIYRAAILEETLINHPTSTPSKKAFSFNSITLISSENKDQLSQPTQLGYVAIQVNKNRLKFEQQSQTLIAFTVALFGTLLSALFAIKLIRQVTKPINSMVQAIDRVREGKLESRVSGLLMGELNLLKTGINAMAQSIHGYQNEMQASIDQATIDLRESLEQFEIQNVELSIAKRKAQEANKVKSEFLANMSHELRTPLNGVIGFTRQVLKTPLTDSQRDYLQTIDRSANNLLTIINDILDFSKLDAGKMVIENIPFLLHESLEETLALLAPSAHKKELEMSINIKQNLPDSLVGDVMRIKQIATNLISNAIKFTPQGSIEIDVTSEQINQKHVLLKLTVKDTGIGMTEKQQRTIFDAFTQADQSITRLYGGTGLGLVICQRLAREMSGNIGFTSEKNQGSSFWFTFQCEINPMPLILELDNHHLSNKSILFFEENDHSRNATLAILNNWQMNVTSIVNNHQLEQVVTHAKQVGLTYDYALIGHSNTSTALSELKKLIALVTPVSPAIYLTLNSNSPSLHEALIANGAMNCLSKPINASRLSKALQPLSHDDIVMATTTEQKILPIKVLAVDDNEANLKLIKALLHEQVAEVILADNGQDALALCKNEHFALIFMDIQMPVMDGISTLKSIREDSLNIETPIIAVTAHALSGEKEKMYQQGFNAYMTKPIDETMLRHIIYEYCDFSHFINNNEDDVKSSIEKSSMAITSPEASTIPSLNSKGVIDWPLALKRAANKTDLAKEMLEGLVESLPATHNSISEAIAMKDTEQVKSLIHKLNGACCYTGTPNLSTITSQIETQLKMGISLTELEPEFMEFFEHIEQVISAAPSAFKTFTEQET